MHKLYKAPLCKGSSRVCTNFTRLPCAKGAPAKRVRDCYSIIFDNQQIGSMCRQSLRRLHRHPPLHKGALLVGANDEHPLCTRGALLVEANNGLLPLHKEALLVKADAVSPIELQQKGWSNNHFLLLRGGH